MPINALIIDPGGSAFGWSHWLNTIAPYACNVFTPRGRRSTDWVGRIQDCAAHLDVLFQSMQPKLVVIEKPFFAPEGAGYGTAGSGALVKLCMAVGSFLEVTRRHKITKLILMEVRDWKPQTKGDWMVRKRVQARLGLALCNRLQITSHAWDSVGMGLHYFTGRL